MKMAATDWEQIGRDNRTWGRHEMRAAIQAAGLELNSRDYHLAFEAIRRGQSEIEQARKAEREQAERHRIEPYREEARLNVLSWGCWEENGPEGDLETFLENCVEEATRLADEVDEAAAEEVRSKERDEAALLDYRQRLAGVDACVASAQAEVADAGWLLEERRCGSDCSRYFWLTREEGDFALSMRISDHYAKNGSGWNESKQEQHDAPDINIVLCKQADGCYGFDLKKLTERLD
jgi:hypothetical protein